MYLRRLTNAGLDPTWISKKIRDMGDNGPGHVPAGIALRGRCESNVAIIPESGDSRLWR